MCSNKTGHVVKLDLRVDPDKFQWDSMSSDISPSILALERLNYLDLSFNDFGGRQIPKFMGSFKNLKYLNLSNADFGGSIPPQLAPRYELCEPQCCCGLGAGLEHASSFFKSPSSSRLLLGNMTSLEELWLGGNDLVGMIPETMKNLHKLKVLDLSQNQISGDRVELMERLPHKIQSLSLWANNLNGSLPNWIENMTSLNTLDLNDNSLTGSIPSGMGKLTNLNYLDLNSNQLVGMILEDHFIGPTRLEMLDLSNNSLTMEVHPNWIPPFRLKEVYLSYCKLGPHFLAWIQSQTNITILGMSSARITDKLPNWFWNVISQIQYLDLSLNQISGVLPMTLEFLSTARSIILHSNQFNGRFPKLPIVLRYLDLSRNYISGPFSLILETVDLGYLLLSNNFISGTIPSSFCNQLPFLEVLDLSNNHLSGRLPPCWTRGSSFRAKSELGDVSLNLVMVNFYNNSLSGKFPLFF
ncbi:receptor like protein 24-like [Typha angustifolia]|uniref:receptor like protein 24-like n=1 Tax=Typha angustifolia TaxID=59011 RepID=UPI003C30CD13